jgi:hypothetical protein
MFGALLRGFARTGTLVGLLSKRSPTSRECRLQQLNSGDFIVISVLSTVVAVWTRFRVWQIAANQARG